MGFENSTSKGTTSPGIFLIAVIMAPVMWCTIVAIGAETRPTNPHAYSTASAAVLCAFGGWLTYHLVSRRNNGLAFFIVSQSVAQAGLPFWHTLWVFLPLQIAIGGLFGLMSRFLTRDKSRHQPIEPLYDAQLDPPAR